MINRIVQEYLEPLVARIRLRRFWLVVAAVAVAALMAMTVCWLWMPQVGPKLRGWIAFGLGVGVFALGAVAGLVWHRRRYGDDFRRAANLIERASPDLELRLATALEQIPEASSGRLSYLQQELIREAIYHGMSNPWTATVPRWHLAGAISVALVGLMLVALLGIVFFRGDGTKLPTQQLAFNDARIADGGYECLIEPGNVSIEKGSSLAIEARFESAVPPNVFLNITKSSGAEQRLSMIRSLNDPVFAVRVPEIDEPFEYSVEFESQRTASYHVDVYELPEIQRIDVELRLPDYLQSTISTIKDVRRLTAVEGSAACFRIFTKRPIARGEFISPAAEPIPIEILDPAQNLYTLTVPLTESRQYEVKVYDDQNRVNRFPPRLVITVTSNQIPKIVVKTPGRDINASALEEVVLAAETWDDFGIQQVGLSWSINGGPAQETTLASDLPARTTTVQTSTLFLEDLRVGEDDLVAYHFWAEDLDSQGLTRRSTSEIYFIEIRPFEMIYRAGETPSAQQMQNQANGEQNSQGAQAAANLAETQKQIISATWNLIRRESAATVSDQFANDAELVARSQAEARQQAAALAGQVQVADSLGLVEQVLQQMDQATTLLQRAAQESQPSLLRDALKPEQITYQTLLRLRARELDVARMNRQQMQRAQAGQANNNSAQMQQLEMDEQRNPYEEATSPNEPESPEARENRQVLNRLRELAQRQMDLNEQIQQLQSEMNRATEDQKAEIERRLKRLQEEQEQILRDSDELRDRMQNQVNQEQMANESRQLEQARENIQRSSEALQDAQLSRAAAEGERAQRQLEELREEFQRRSTNQFQDEIQRMQRDARDLAQRQLELNRQMLQGEQRPNDQPQGTLRDAETKEDLATQLREQRQRFEQLQQTIRETVERAEQAEPLLADQLYDSYRQLQQQEPDEALQAAARAWERGWQRDAVEQAERARQSLEDLRDGIELAGERILGDETQRLRRAAAELERLGQELSSEIQRRDPETPEDEARPAADERREAMADAAGNRRQDDAETDRLGNESPRSGEPDASSRSTARAPENRSLPLQRIDPDGRSLRDDGLLDRLDTDWSGDPNRRMGRNTREINPLSGEEFRQWLDRLRDVEEMVADDALRQDVARIRRAAREFRRELQDPNSPPPTWDLARIRVMQPLRQLQDRIREELLKKSGEKMNVPLDRDPVPAEYQDAVQRYFQELGAGK